MASAVGDARNQRKSTTLMRVAIVHYWLVGMRGGERVVEALCELYPEADIFTHVYAPERIAAEIRRHAVYTTFISKLPWPRRLYRSYLPLMPLALEELDLRPYDLVISSESGPAKGVLTRPDATHICYCHTPMRYIWNMYQEYRGELNGFNRITMSIFAHWLRQWDVQSAARVDHFVANSYNVAARIHKYYRRDAVVIHPPVDVDTFGGHPDKQEDFYLCVGQLIPYKKFALAIEAFNQMGKPLVVIGEGNQQAELRRLTGPTIRLLNRVDDATLRGYYKRCRALVFPGEEDFGIVPLEAMLAGRPVLAFGRGGALETMIPGRTGLFFEEQTVKALSTAVERFEKIETLFVSAQIAAHARAFSKGRFKEAFGKFADDAIAAKKPSYTRLAA